MAVYKAWAGAVVAACILAPLAAQADPRCRTQSLRGEWLASFSAPTADDGPLVCQFGFVDRQGGLSGHCRSIHFGPGGTEVLTHGLTGDLHVTRSCELSGGVTVTTNDAPYDLQINGQVWSGNTPKVSAGSGHAHVMGGEGLELFMAVTMHRIAWSDPAFPRLPEATPD